MNIFVLLVGWLNVLWDIISQSSGINVLILADTVR